MGEVYLCMDSETADPYALKTFPAHRPDLRSAFVREVETWIALGKNANIVRCFRMEILDNQPFLFLEWVIDDEIRHAALKNWVAEGTLELALSLDFTLDICRGLAHADGVRPGTVHGD